MLLVTLPGLFEWLRIVLFVVSTGANAGTAGPVLSEPESIKVLTYNVLHHTDTFVDYLKLFLFDESLPSDRIAPTLDLLERQQADLIALQEVTSPFLEAMHNEPWLRGYHIETTLAPAMTGWRRYLAEILRFLFGHQSWGQAILSKWPVTEAHVYPMGRPLLVTEITIGRMSLTVATCHLDSFRENARIRIQQMDQAFKILGRANNAIFLGDFNFSDEAAENAKIPPAYLDVWQQLKPDDPGYTYDTRNNPLVVDKVSPGKPGRRLDRILVRSRELEPASVTLIGKDETGYDGGPTDFSDHYGVAAVLRKSAQR